MKRDPEYIVRIVANHYGLPVVALLGRGRRYGVAKARHVAMFLACRHGSSASEVGRAMRKDHTTVLHGVDRIGGLVERCADTRRAVAEIEATISSDPVHSLAEHFPERVQKSVLALIEEASVIGRDAMCSHLSAGLLAILASEQTHNPETVT